MSEPETITLRKLPPEHVLRRCDVYFDSMGSVNAGSSIGKHVLETDHVWWCRAEDYPAEYDKPGIDPGEGWRIYDQHKEGMEPRPDAQYRTHIGTWVNRPYPNDNLTDSDVYRVPVTPQPDRLTELRQQGERQAKRIEELEEQAKELEAKIEKEKFMVDAIRSVNSVAERAIAQRNEQIDGLRARLAKRVDEVESLQTQVRSAEEALRVERQKHDEAVKQLEKSIDVYDHGVTKIYNTLNDVSPGWYRHDGNAYDDACKAIRLLATQNKSLIEQSNKTHEANVELQRQVQQLAEQNKPLRWERRKPTEEECRERWVLEWDGNPGILHGWTPESVRPEYDWRELICILPPIAEPEPERRMITQRRWLVNGPEGWQEAWPKDGEAPGSEWLELIKTSMTREVPE